MNPDRIIALRSTLTVFRDGDRCLKVFGAEHTQSSVLCEAFNAASAAEVGVCTPRVLGVTEFDGMPAIVSEFVKGKTLAAIASGQGSVHGCLERFAREHALVNSFAAPMLRSEKDAAAEGILRSGLPQGQIAALLEQNAAFPEGDRLLHGTPEMSNIIIDNGGGAHVVGWSRAVKGCPAADVARGYILARRIYGTAAAEEYLELRCRAGDVGAEDAARRIPVAAAAMLHYANEYERKALRALINTD